MQILSFVLIEENDNYLLICEASPEWKGKWYFPGGKMESNENPVTAALRETKEETGCDVVLDGFFYSTYNNQFLKRKLNIYYHGRVDCAILKNFPDEHSLACRWFNYHDLSKLPLRQNALEVIEKYRSLKTLLPIHSFNVITEEQMA